MRKFQQTLLYAAICTGMALSCASGTMAAVIDGPDSSSPLGYEYFLRPYVRYGGSIIDGIVRNGATVSTQQFHDNANSFISTVNLNDGTIKTYASMYGPSMEYGQATGVMGDVIRYTGSEDTAVSVRFDYDLLINVYQDVLGDETPPDSARYFGFDTYFAVYEADSNTTWDNWTQFGDHADEALYVGREFVNFGDNSYNYIEDSYFGSLGTDLFLQSGKSYKIYAAYNLQIIPGSFHLGEITLNALYTSTLGINAPEGDFTSLSGAFLGFEKTPDAPVDPGVPGVPEPATWAMLILGFGLVGGSLRRRERMMRQA